MISPIQLVIPAAGAGSRFRQVGELTPKPLIEVGGFPMILWVLSNFQLNVGDFVVVVCQREDELPSKLKKYLKAIPYDVEFIEIDGLTDGPASTVARAIPILNFDNPVIVANSDQFVSADMTEYLNSVRSKKNPGTILTMKASGNKWSYIGRDAVGKVEQVVEKIQISNEATVGIYAWANSQILKDAITFLKESNFLVNNEFYIAPSYNFLVERGLDIGCISVGNHGEKVHGLGTPEDLQNFLKHPDFPSFQKYVEVSLRGR
jgi:NDP-sugar pyrophosphorylase family protein